MCVCVCVCVVCVCVCVCVCGVCVVCVCVCVCVCVYHAPYFHQYSECNIHFPFVPTVLRPNADHDIILVVSRSIEFLWTSDQLVAETFA